jgi:hypothetical protein
MFNARIYVLYRLSVHGDGRRPGNWIRGLMLSG